MYLHQRASGPLRNLFVNSVAMQCCIRSNHDSAKPFSAIPGPKPLPIFGNMLKEGREFSQGKVREEYVLSRLIKQYGNVFKIYFMNSPLVIVNDADSVGHIFKNEGKVPVRMSLMEQNHKWIHEKNKMPVGMVFSHKNDWKRLRSAMTKQVTPRRLVHFTEPLSAVSDSLCRHIGEEVDRNGWLTDVWHPLQNWALKGTTKIVFAEDIDTFSGNDPKTKEFIKTAMEFIYALEQIGLALPLYKLFPTKPYKQFINSYTHLRKLGKELLNNHYEELQKSIEQGTVDEDNAVGLLDQWLIEGKLTEEEALVQACDMLGVGIDTTSNTATFLLHELSKNHKIQEAAYKEIVDVVGPESKPTTDQLQKLSLIRRCVKETLRLYPLLPMISREVPNDIVILDYQVPAGTTCVFNYFALSMDPRYFKEPEKFDPDRWSHDSKGPHPFASLPFGFGPRMCYGRRIAELELHILITRVLQRFKLHTDQMTIKQSFYSVLHPEEPVRIQFIPRS